MSILIQHFKIAAWLCLLHSTIAALIMFEISALLSTLSLGKVHGTVISLSRFNSLFFSQIPLSFSSLYLSSSALFS